MFLRGNFSCDPEVYKDAILEFISTYETCALLDSNASSAAPIPLTGVQYLFIAGAGVQNNLEYAGNSFDDAAEFITQQEQNKNWLLGYLSYDVKNEFEKLSSLNPSGENFPLIHFFVPRYLFIATATSLEIISAGRSPSEIFEKISGTAVHHEIIFNEVRLTKTIVKKNYIDAVEKIISHIRRGDIYELNYCCEILGKAKNIDTTATFRKLNKYSPNPFACYYSVNSNYLLCASPERFLKKSGEKILSQPMKGTAKRSSNPVEDMQSKAFLLNSEKERSENVMIVDLVRNDLSKVAEMSSVNADELFGVYSFERSHQMISTVSCMLKSGIKFQDIIKAAFPMGSMTGAPKVSAMKLIDRYEDFRRGIFSGTAGYIDPHGNFDLNVVIRSIRYNAETGIIAMTAGGAITAASEPELEYQEMMLKLMPQLQAAGLDMANLTENHA